MQDRIIKNTPNLLDIRDVLGQLGIEWKTEENLKRLHQLAEQSIHALGQVVGSWHLVDTPNELPITTLQNLWVNFLRVVVEIKCFPDHPPEGTVWEQELAAVLEEYLEHERQKALTWTRIVSVVNPWSIRESVKAAWNIEFASVGGPFSIGRTDSDSAHRTALKCASDLWLGYEQYVHRALETPQRRSEYWESLVNRWDNRRVRDDSSRVRAFLTSERNRLSEKLFPMPPCSTAAASAVNVAEMVVNAEIVNVTAKEANIDTERGAKSKRDSRTENGRSRKRRVKREAAEPLIADHLKRRPHDTVREVAKAVGCSTGLVSGSQAWKLNRQRLKISKKAGIDPRAFRLSEKAINADGDDVLSRMNDRGRAVEEMDDAIDQRERQLHASIGEYLKSNPDATAEDIAEAVGCEVRDVQRRQEVLNKLIVEQEQSDWEDTPRKKTEESRPAQEWVNKQV